MTSQRKERIHNVLSNRQPDLAVVLENVEDPHNMSAVMRSSESVGVQDVYILRTRTPKHPKFDHKISGSAMLWLTVHEFTDAEECFAALRKRYGQILATHLGEQATSLYSHDLKVPTALVFGNERKGLTKEALQHCTGNFIIPQVGMVQSLNISVACAVSLYEAYRQREAAGMYDGVNRLPEGEYSDLNAMWSARSAE